jgi:hypothetical protein
MRKTRFTNRAFTTLNGSITSSATSVTVTSAADFPTEGDFYIAIGNEMVKVTGVSGSVFTVVRGRDGNLPVAHPDAEYVFAVISRDQMNDWGSDIHPLGNFGWGNKISDKDGVPLDDTDFTNLNFGTSTKGTDTWGAIRLSAQGTSSSNEFRLLTRTQPTTPYTIIAHVDIGLGGYHDVEGAGVPLDGKQVGIGFLDTSTEEISVLTIAKQDEAKFYHWDTYNGFVIGTEAGATDFYGKSDIWMKITNDGTTLTGYVSNNAGLKWFEIGTVTIDVDMTPDKVFFGAQHGTTTTDGPAKLLAWYEIED